MAAAEQGSQRSSPRHALDRLVQPVASLEHDATSFGAAANTVVLRRPRRHEQRPLSSGAASPDPRCGREEDRVLPPSPPSHWIAHK